MLGLSTWIMNLSLLSVTCPRSVFLLVFSSWFFERCLGTGWLISHTGCDCPNRGHTSLTYRYDSWKQARSVSSAPPQRATTGELWSFTAVQSASEIACALLIGTGTGGVIPAPVNQSTKTHRNPPLSSSALPECNTTTSVLSYTCRGAAEPPLPPIDLPMLFY